MDGDLGLQLVRQQAEVLLLVGGLVAHPQVVEPLDDPVLELEGHPPQPHVRLDGIQASWRREREENEKRNVLFNDALNTFYLRLYGVRHMVKDHSDSEKGNPLPPHRLLLSINSKGSFICTIPQTG